MNIMLTETSNINECNNENLNLKHERISQWKLRSPISKNITMKTEILNTNKYITLKMRYQTSMDVTMKTEIPMKIKFLQIV